MYSETLGRERAKIFLGCALYAAVAAAKSPVVAYKIICPESWNLLIFVQVSFIQPPNKIVFLAVNPCSKKVIAALLPPPLAVTV